MPPLLDGALLDADLELAGYPISPARAAEQALTDAVEAGHIAGMADGEILEALEAGDPTVDWATAHTATDTPRNR